MRRLANAHALRDTCATAFCGNFKQESLKKRTLPPFFCGHVAVMRWTSPVMLLSMLCWNRLLNRTACQSCRLAFASFPVLYLHSPDCLREQWPSDSSGRLRSNAWQSEPAHFLGEQRYLIPMLVISRC